jgi:hypothetical protein
MKICHSQEACTGCTACKHICPTAAIAMRENDEGFLYPEVDENLCIHCGRCVRVCPQNHKPPYREPRGVYAVKHKEQMVRVQSTSGGMFTALSDWILQRGGVVYGAAFDEAFSVSHIMAETALERNRMRGSKYVQSALGEVFAQIKKNLAEDRYVLFTGTPCQVDGLRSFIGKPNNKLFLVDIVCYGTPSPLLFREYIHFIKEDYQTDIRWYTFRNKKASWRTGKSHVELVNNKTVSKEKTEIFDRLFWSGNIIRTSCYTCPYTKPIRISDITIGDCWGVEKMLPAIEDAYGVSLCLVNTEQGARIFEAISKMIEYYDISSSSNWQQPRMQSPTERPSSREQFWSDYHKKGFLYIARKYTHWNLIRIAIRKIRSIIR